MEPPEGLKVKDKDIVCHLKKSLYGLKQSSRVWNTRFTNYLAKINLFQYKSDPCVFIGIFDNERAHLLLYVDDELTVSTVKIQEKILKHLENNFSISAGTVLLCWFRNSER